jgi:Ca2+-binding EF-hand superfamily protein
MKPILLAAAFFAQNSATPPVAEGGLTRAQVEAQVRDAFTRADANRDGFVTQAEGQAASPPRDAEEGERRGRRGIRFGGRGFERMDGDKDGRVSLAEATAARLQRFERMDTNRDGVVTREERQALRAQRRDDRS